MHVLTMCLVCTGAAGQSCAFRWDNTDSVPYSCKQLQPAGNACLLCRSSDLGLRTEKGEEWANLRLAAFSSAMASYYITLADVPPSDAIVVRLCSL